MKANRHCARTVVRMAAYSRSARPLTRLTTTATLGFHGARTNVRMKAISHGARTVVRMAVNRTCARRHETSNLISLIINNEPQSINFFTTTTAATSDIIDCID